MTDNERKKTISALRQLLAMCDFVDQYGNRIVAAPYFNAVETAIELLNETRWIPVSKEPKENGEYIVSLEDSVYPEASFFNGKWFMQPLNGIAREFGEYEVIAWMPLPEPYRKDGE